MDIKIIFLLISLHFVADFLLQNDKMALNKSSSVKWLVIHCFVYYLPFYIVEVAGLLPVGFSILNGTIHFMIDFISSKVSKKFYNLNNRYLFFLIIGLDQLIHYVTLFLTYVHLTKGKI